MCIRDSHNSISFQVTFIDTCLLYSGKRTPGWKGEVFAAVMGEFIYIEYMKRSCSISNMNTIANGRRLASSKKRRRRLYTKLYRTCSSIPSMLEYCKALLPPIFQVTKKK